MKFFLLLLTLTFFSFSNTFAEDSYFIDFTKVLNDSKAGSKAQEQLKKKFSSESAKYKKQAEDIKKSEKEIISQKKMITNEEYQKKVQALRKIVANHQQNKQKSLNSIAKSRDEAKLALLTAVKPIISKYMQENKIKIVLDKKSVLMGDNKLEITDQIIAIVNKEVSSIKVN
tara:strand:+ start:2448 stop:2963 length:516 start_codon:yes stop_codon:yes gene_type:complete